MSWDEKKDREKERKKERRIGGLELNKWNSKTEERVGRKKKRV